MVRLIESRGARDIAKRALETTGQIFRYGLAHGFAKRNPATEIRPRNTLEVSRKVNFARIDAKELPTLLRQLEVYPGTHLTRLAIKLMALTFVRTSELIAAKWPEFDLEAARWDIPANRMKMRTAHTCLCQRRPSRCCSRCVILPAPTAGSSPANVLRGPTYEHFRACKSAFPTRHYFDVDAVSPALEALPIGTMGESLEQCSV